MKIDNDNKAKIFRKRFVIKEVHGFSGYTEIHWSDGHVNKHIPGISHSNLMLGRQNLNPGIPWWGYFYNPETGKYGQWVIYDELNKLTVLTEKEYGDLYSQYKELGVPFYALRYNPETGKKEGTWAVSDESNKITFLTDEEKRNYVIGKSNNEPEL